MSSFGENSVILRQKLNTIFKIKNLQSIIFLKNIEKGFYKDNYLNRKLGRVGQAYGKDDNMNINQQQILEDFKQKVIDCLKKKYNYTKEDIKDCLQERKEIWEQYMKDFSPEITAQGIASGLI